MDAQPEPPEEIVFDDPLGRQTTGTARLWGRTGDGEWGEAPLDDPGTAEDDLARFLADKPPHHL